MANDTGKSVGAHFAKPDLRTSRRNFLAGVSVLAGALGGAMIVGRKAHAQSAQGCDSSNNAPKGCEPYCFLGGTRIATPNGEVQIEKLRIGDLVTCVSGEPKPIKWIGRNRFTRTVSGAWQPGQMPIKVSRYALDGKTTPRADLYLSPNHAIYLGGRLIPVNDLVNGISITESHHADALTLEYYHIDLETHDVVFAEGASAETYLGNTYSAFDNGQEYIDLYGAPTGMKQPFAPVVSFNGRRNELFSRLRSIVSPIYDVRDTRDVIRDEIASRAELAWAA